jgi:molybdopterin-guanine dinucleotide biosynthesis protein A
MSSLPSELLPIHGFVLAGGKSSRMGEDKALLRFCGRPMVEIAVEKLRGFCAEVGIAGNREDLAEFAPVVWEARVNVGPAAGIEAGLGVARQPWAMFIPVDVPLIPETLLRKWAEKVVALDGISASYLYYRRAQPAFCMLRCECEERFAEALDGGEQRVERLISVASEGACRVFDLQMLYGEDSQDAKTSDRWFTNVNTPEDLVEAERWASGVESGSTRLGSDEVADDGASRESVHHKKNNDE